MDTGMQLKMMTVCGEKFLYTRFAIDNSCELYYICTDSLKH